MYHDSRFMNHDTSNYYTIKIYINIIYVKIKNNFREHFFNEYLCNIIIRADLGKMQMFTFLGPNILEAIQICKIKKK